MRTALVLATTGGALAKMLPAFRFGVAGKLGSGRQWWSWVSLRDAARAFAFAVENELVHGALNLAAPQPVTNAEFTRTLGRVLHRPTLLAVPAFALRALGGEMAEEMLLASQQGNSNSVCWRRDSSLKIRSWSRRCESCCGNVRG